MFEVNAMDSELDERLMAMPGSPGPQPGAASEPDRCNVRQYHLPRPPMLSHDRVPA